MRQELVERLQSNRPGIVRTLRQNRHHKTPLVLSIPQTSLKGIEAVGY